MWIGLRIGEAEKKDASILYRCKLRPAGEKIPADDSGARASVADEVAQSSSRRHSTLVGRDLPWIHGGMAVLSSIPVRERESC